MKFGKFALVSLSGLAAIGLVAGCGAASAPAPTQAQVQAAVLQRVESYYNHANDNPALASYQITAIQLYAALQKDPQDYFLMDVRTPGNKVNFGITAYGYNGEHIGGAINVPYGTAVATALAQGKIPTNKKIITICYTGQWANQTAALLRILGYNAYALHLSMSAWNKLTDVIPGVSQVPSYPLVSGSAPGTFTAGTTTTPAGS
jgi:rhodanese-related sulfurtransferase